METYRTLIGLLCFVGAALAASLCLAQDVPTSAQAAAGAQQEPYITVFSLAHADAHAVRDAIEALDLHVWVTATNDTTLVLRGSEPIVRHIQTGLLQHE